MGWAILLAYLLAINLYTYREYGYDKHASKFKVWRTSERMLIRLAMLGGTPAAIYACKKFRHKTKKTSFKLQLYLAAFIQIIFIGVIAFS
jgi:uncharacterized membrane protein YsdA (DUF1294 family)